MVGGRSARGSRRQSCCGKRRRPVSARCGRCSPGSRALRPFRPFAARRRSAILVAVGVAYWIAYATPVFAVKQVDVRGAPPALTREVTQATSDLMGKSLVAVDARQVEGGLARASGGRGGDVDRAFPHTLVVADRARAARCGDPAGALRLARDRRRQGDRDDPDRYPARAAASLARARDEHPGRRPGSRRR